MSKSSKKMTVDQAVAQAYESVADANDGRIGSREDVIAEAERILPAAVIEDMRRQAFEGAYDRVDRRLTERAKSSQLNLFTGDSDSIDGFFVVGGGERVRVRKAKSDDWRAQGALIDQNVINATAAQAMFYAQWAKIAQYMMVPGTTTEQAIEAYYRDHPDERSNHADDRAAD